MQLSEIQQGLAGTHFRTLPLLLDPPLASLPRIYSVAWAFVAHTDGAFDEDLLAAFLDAYQDVRELTHICCDHIGQFDAQALDQVLALLGRRGVGRVFLTQTSQRLQDRRLASQTRVLAWLQQALPDAAAGQIQQLADQAADNLSVSNALRRQRCRRLDL